MYSPVRYARLRHATDHAEAVGPGVERLDIEFAAFRLDQRCAVLDPVARVEVGHLGSFDHCGRVQVPTDHSLTVEAAGMLQNRRLELAQEADHLLDLLLPRSTQPVTAPLLISQPPRDPPVRRQSCVVSPGRDLGEPLSRAFDHVKVIAMRDEKAAAILSDMNKLVGNIQERHFSFDGGYDLGITQERVVISRRVEDLGPRVCQIFQNGQYRDQRVFPIPGVGPSPAIDDVTDQIELSGSLAPEHLEKRVALSMPTSEMGVAHEKRANLLARFPVHWCNHSWPHIPRACDRNPASGLPVCLVHASIPSGTSAISENDVDV